ncbi:hypothetical protein ACTOB_007072 [Actinoplanes oblitus]|uniref:Uncharacterized protein n=1 Tax=Actinoplanes oblitus TaxID=3040509 RepID=A0ABY8WD18_9ACTN|nr:hypothetical protein [Actinoplanes oblitus]WIM95011.1 hypothetical protein ACTOB_007072 [Actinoplanes oblitus]
MTSSVSQRHPPATVTRKSCEIEDDVPEAAQAERLGACSQVSPKLRELSFAVGGKGLSVKSDSASNLNVTDIRGRTVSPAAPH